MHSQLLLTLLLALLCATLARAAIVPASIQAWRPQWTTQASSVVATSASRPDFDVLKGPKQHALASSRHLPPLYFRQRRHASHAPDSRFKILIVSDTHLLDDQTVPGNASNVSRASTKAVRSYLRAEQPDFVIHLGDIVSGENANRTSDVRHAVEQILSPMVEAQVPFATTKGNHDNDRFSTHAQITDYEHAYAPMLSYTCKAPKGIGGGDVGSDNYWLPVYSSRHASPSLHNVHPRPSLLLWFFDSRAGHHRQANGSLAGVEDWVDATVAPWILRETRKMEQRWKTLPPSLVFVHIPTHAHLTTQTKAPYARHVGGITNETIVSHPNKRIIYPGLNDDKPAATQGKENDKDRYRGQDRAFLDAILKGPAGKARILAITSGHDHGNDWCAPGSEHTATGQIVPLCYAKHSGFGGYDHKQWNHGARVFDVSLQDLEHGGVKTYIRYLTGEKRYDTMLDNRWANKVPI